MSLWDIRPDHHNSFLILWQQYKRRICEISGYIFIPFFLYDNSVEAKSLKYLVRQSQIFSCITTVQKPNLLNIHHMSSALFLKYDNGTKSELLRYLDYLYSSFLIWQVTTVQKMKRWIYEISVYIFILLFLYDNGVKSEPLRFPFRQS